MKLYYGDSLTDDHLDEEIAMRQDPADEERLVAE